MRPGLFRQASIGPFGGFFVDQISVRLPGIADQRVALLPRRRAAKHARHVRNRAHARLIEHE